MILNNKQEEGLRIAVARYNNKDPYTCIAGYAGTGKSTLLKFIIAALDLDPEFDVCYVAFTGKATTVLQQKGCPNATTAHKLLYHAKQMPDGKYTFVPKKERPLYKLIIVDEVSMLPKEMWELLLRWRIPIIACGDPEQLPPVDKDADNHVLDKPDIFLDEVMRQAQDSEIIRLSMWIREGNLLENFQCNKQHVQVLNKNELVGGMYDWADQILCATNGTRNNINNYVRQMRGFGPEPQAGDKIISLNNHWEFFSKSGDWALTNGCIGTIKAYGRDMIRFPRYISEKPIEYMLTDIEIEDNDSFLNIPIDYHYLTTGESALTGKQIYQIRNNKKIEIDPPYDFAYGYAITTHKAQGSEWSKVLVIEERFPFDKIEHRRWLYTAITRASQKLVVIKK